MNPFICKRFTTGIGVVCLLVSVLFSQPVSAQGYVTVKTAPKKSQEAFRKAGDLIARRDFAGAILDLEKLTVQEPGFIDAWLLLGELYNEQGEFQKGRTALERSISLNPEFSSRSWYYLAQSCWNLDAFKCCQQAGEKFLSFSSLSAERKNEITRMLAHAAFSEGALQRPVPFQPVSLGEGVNSSQPEYLASLTGDEQQIVFTRRLGKGLMANEDFYVSRKQEVTWSVAQPLSDQVNSSYNEGAQSITPDGNALYYVVCDKPGGYGSCDIYTSVRNGATWSPVKNLGAPVNTNAWESQPCISASGSALYFVSNRPGGKGGSDIWVVYKDTKGRWQAPQNLGDSVNTKYDEKSPFLHPDGKTLYFSSAGWPGLGGDDIFISRKNEQGTWSMPVNIGYPINSKNDENSFLVSLDGHTAYFSSDRLNESRNFDLYWFELYEEARPSKTTFVKGRVMDETSSVPVAARIRLLDLKTGAVIAESVADPVDGGYLLSVPSGNDYALSASSPGYLLYSAHFSLKMQPVEKPFNLDVLLKPLVVGNTVILKNIFFDTDSYVLKDESMAELAQLVTLLQENLTIKILIAGHTDNEGDDAYNQQLSENRAKAVYEFLVGKGIAYNRMGYTGFGESQPVAPNTSEEGRAQNRRTAFTITAR